MKTYIKSIWPLIFNRYLMHFESDLIEHPYYGKSVTDMRNDLKQT